MEYVIFWTLDGCQYHQTFDTLDEAATKLDDWSDAYPHNTYYLARVIGHLPSTVARNDNASDAKLREAYSKFNEIARKAFRHGQTHSVYTPPYGGLVGSTIPCGDTRTKD